jgi:5'-nucleotidase
MDGGDVDEAAAVARLVAMHVIVTGLPPKTFININVPAGTPKGIRVTRLGHRVYSEKVVEQKDPRGRTHYWIGGGPPAWDALEGTDMGAVHEGFVSVTPLHLDLTHHGMLSQMGDWSAALTAQYPRRTSPRAAPMRRRRAR